MIKFKLWSNNALGLKEHYDQQIEKHKAYLKAGFRLVKQRFTGSVIIREYKN